jgi:subtilisin family serine protease
MRVPGVTFIAAAAVAAAFALPSAAAAVVPCAPVPTTYESGGAPSASSPNDPLLGAQWGLTQINAQGAWNRGALGGGQTIAIVDTGVDLAHPDLVGKLLPGIDLVSDETCTPGAQDLNGHGTHVAGIAAAAANNGIGVVGTAPNANILPVRVLDATGSGTGEDIVAGIKWAVDQGAGVVNLSIGEGIDPGGLIGQQTITISSPIDIAEIGKGVDYAWNKGAVVVAAAGNSSFPLCEYPAASAHAICVGATDHSNFPSGYSNFPIRLDGGVAVLAPGGDASGSCDATSDIWSTYWPAASGDMAEHCAPKGYEPLAGTSMATPFVSGLAAMLRGAGMSNQQVLDCLKQKSSNGGSYDPIYGYGIVNADAAVGGCAGRPVTGNPWSPSKTTGQTTPQTPGTTPTSDGQQTSGDGQVLAERDQSDTTPPRVRVSIPKSKSAHIARAGYITVRVRLSEDARVWMQVRNGRETQAVSREAIVLATTLAKVKAGKSHDLRLKLTRVGRRIVRLHRTLRVTIFAYAQDAAKNNGTAIAEARIRR